MASPSTSRSVIDGAIASLQNGDAPSAERRLRELLAREADDAEARLYLAQALAAQDDLDGAIAEAEHCYTVAPRPEIALVGGMAALRLADEDRVMVWASRVKGIKPSHLLTLRKLAQRHASAGYYRAAADYFAAALTCAPDDFESLRSFCFYAAMFDRTAAISVLESYIGRNLRNLRLVSLAQWLLLPLKEHMLRSENGLGIYSPYIDLHFRFAESLLAQWTMSVREWLAQEPDSPEALTMMALALVAHGRPLEAEPYLRRLRPLVEINPLTVTHFGPEFFVAVDSAEERLGHGFPAVETLVAGEPSSASVFVGCDFDYFERFGWTLVRSFVAEPHGVFLRLHIFDLAPEQRGAFLERLAAAMAGSKYSVTTEDSGLRGQGKPAAIYYHAIRFLRAAQFQDQAEHPLCIVDADMVFMGAADCAFTLLGESDSQLLFSPGRIETSNQITACAAIFAASPGGRAYLRRVAAYIAVCFGRSEMLWGIDQVAFYAVYAEMQANGRLPRLAPVPPSVHDGQFSAGTLLWASKSASQDPNASALREALARFREPRGS